MLSSTLTSLLLAAALASASETADRPPRWIPTQAVPLEGDLAVQPGTDTLVVFGDDEVSWVDMASGEVLAQEEPPWRGKLSGEQRSRGGWAAVSDGGELAAVVGGTVYRRSAGAAGTWVAGHMGMTEGSRGPVWWTAAGELVLMGAKKGSGWCGSSRPGSGLFVWDEADPDPLRSDRPPLDGNLRQVGRQLRRDELRLPDTLGVEVRSISHARSARTDRVLVDLGTRAILGSFELPGARQGGASGADWDEAVASRAHLALPCDEGVCMGPLPPLETGVLPGGDGDLWLAPTGDAAVTRHGDDLVIWDLAAGTVHLASDLLLPAGIAWSPDGQELAVSALRSGGLVTDLLILDRTGRELRREQGQARRLLWSESAGLVRVEGVWSEVGDQGPQALEVLSEALSPHGTRMVMLLETGSLVMVDLTTGEELRRSHGTAPLGGWPTEGGRAPRRTRVHWSPDDVVLVEVYKHINTFPAHSLALSNVTERAGSSGGALRIMNATFGTAPTRPTDPVSAGSERWDHTPNGRVVAWQQRGAVVVVDRLEGTVETLLPGMKRAAIDPRAPLPSGGLASSGWGCASATGMEAPRETLLLALLGALLTRRRRALPPQA